MGTWEYWAPKGDAIKKESIEDKLEERRESTDSADL